MTRTEPDSNGVQSYVYYPGCTMKAQAHNFEVPTLKLFEYLDHPLVEPDRWSCCGAVFPLALDNHMHLVSPTRSLAIASNAAPALVTACAACYNVLKRTNYVLQSDDEIRTKLNAYLADEVDPVQYRSSVEVLHIMEVLRDHIGVDYLKERFEKRLPGLRVAPFYGCLLLRPKESVAIDDPEAPTIMEDLLGATGATVVDFPYRTECCGAYLVASEPSAVLRSSGAILQAAAERHIEALVVSCPLCHHNLEWTQQVLRDEGKPIDTVAIIYITQLLGLAAGIDPDDLRFDLNEVPVNRVVEAVVSRDEVPAPAPAGRRRRA